MTRHYMRDWRMNRALHDNPCECGQGPRVGYEKGCARCEAMDRQRYTDERMVDVVRRRLARFDLVSLAELSSACGVTNEQTRSALRHLIERGEAESVGESTATEYRPTRRAA